MKQIIFLLIAVSFTNTSYARFDYEWNGIRSEGYGFLTLGGAQIVGGTDQELHGAPSGDIKRPLDDDLDIVWPTTLGLHHILSYDDFSLVTQAVVLGRKDWQLDWEWAYLAYKPTDNLTIRAGKMVSPFLMLSQVRHVGLAYPWPLPLFDLYGLGGEVKGVDAIYRRPIGDWDLIFNPFYLEDRDIQSYGKFKGFQLSLLKEDWLELWFMYSAHKFDTYPWDIIINDAVYPTLLGYGYPEVYAAGIRDEMLNDPYFSEDSLFRRPAIGFRYEDEDLYLMGHLAKHLGGRLSPDMVVWYLVSGWNITPRLMPYFEYGYSKNTGSHDPYHAPAGGYIETFGLESAVDELVEYTYRVGYLNLEVSAIGFRYAYQPGIDIKAELRRFNAKHNTNNFIFSPNGRGHVDMFTFAINMVF